MSSKSESGDVNYTLTVTACSDAALTDVNQTRLPRNKAERISIAITTVKPTSWSAYRGAWASTTPSSQPRRAREIDLYSGLDNNTDHATKAFAATLNAGATFTPAATLWGDVDHLKKYDIVILSCEGALLENEKPMTARQAMYDYESIGQVLCHRWYRHWFTDLALVPTIGTWHDYYDPSLPDHGDD